MPEQSFRTIAQWLRHGAGVVAATMTVLTAALVGTPSWAQVYKWVDESGVTHYSDQAPAKAAKKVDVVADRLSVYTPDPSLRRASARVGGDPTLSERIERLERELRAERDARQSAAAAEAQEYMAAYEQCLADRRVDCDAYDGYYSRGAPVLVVTFQHRRFRHRVLPRMPGLIAGNVAGSKGFMPGNFNGANAITAGNAVSFRSDAFAPKLRTFTPGS